MVHSVISFPDATSCDKERKFIISCYLFCEYQSVVRNIRKEVILAQLRLGHTRVTHSYLLQGEEQPQCVGCDAPFTVRHFILECGDFAHVRNNCFHVDSMKELFQDIHIDSIMTFFRQINLFNKI